MDTDLVEFRQLQEVGIFSYLVYSLAKSHFMDGDLLWPGRPCYLSQIFEPSEEILTCVVVNSADPRVSVTPRPEIVYSTCNCRGV